MTNPQVTLLAQIAPQRSTQYSSLALVLAPCELRLSALGSTMQSLEQIELGGQTYLKLGLSAALEAGTIKELGPLAMCSGYFECLDTLQDQPGPWLRPIELGFVPAMPPELVVTRRYRGKTNEMFTQFLCNIARASSAFAQTPWAELRLLDPLAGGGTTLFTGLMLGADVAGVEQSKEDVESTSTFFTQYVREQGIACQIKDERLKKLGRRWWFTMGKEVKRNCIMAYGETEHSDELLANVKRFHLIVTDLPYGIQHRGGLDRLLQRALPVWKSLLLPGGAMVCAWDATRAAREEMVALVQSYGLDVRNTPPYDAMAHRVDRVIKARDVLVARV
jgi:hypothetical protein